MKKRIKKILVWSCEILGALCGLLTAVLYICILANINMPFWVYLLTSVMFNVFLIYGIFVSFVDLIKFIKEQRK